MRPYPGGYHSFRIGPQGYVLHELPQERLTYIMAWMTRRGLRVDNV